MKINLETLWINADPAGDLSFSDALEVESTSGLVQTESGNLRVRNTTGGRSRASVLPGGSGEWQVECGLASPAEVAWLRKYRLTLLCFRDHLGQKIFGTFADVQRSPVVWDDLYVVSLKVTQVDFSEVV